MTIPISQLFTPLPSGVVAGVTPTTVASGTWLFNEIQNGSALSLPVTSWQSGGVAWTELMIHSVGMATSDSTISLHAQAAFLDFCATGTVIFPDPTDPFNATITVPVTPDPSIPAQNSTGALGWLDVLADSKYNVQRLLASYANVNLLFVNTTGVSLGSIPTGTFHAANSVTGATYNNSVTFTGVASTVRGTSVSAASATSPVVVTTLTNHGIPSDTTLYFKSIGVLPDGFYFAHVSSATQLTLTGTSGTGSYSGSAGRVYTGSQIPFVADVIGTVSNAAPGQINSLVSAAPGVFVTNLLPASGNPYESNVALAARCRAKLGALSLNGPKGAYDYFARTSSTILAAQIPPKTLTSAITRESDVSISGNVAVVVANANGPVGGVTNLAITGATNASPIVLTVGSTSGITTGMTGIVSGVQGNAAANGYFSLTFVDGTHVSLDGTTGSGAYTSGGNLEAGDLGLVDSVIQAYAVPNGVTATTQSATALNVTITATVYVPIAFVADYGSITTTNKGAVAVTNYVASIPIGGITGLDGSTSGIIPYSKLIEILLTSGTTGGREYTLSVSNLLVNGAAADLSMTSVQVAVPVSVSIAVQGV